MGYNRWIVMLIFRTDESILNGVLENAMYASNTRPIKAKPGNIILIYETKKFVGQHEKPINYVMDFVSYEEDINDETVKIWGTKSKYIIKGKNLREVKPFDIKDIQVSHIRYGNIPGYGYIKEKDQPFVLEWIGELKNNYQRKGFWSRQSPGKKAGLLLGGSCFIFFLILIIVGATMVPYPNTTETNNSTNVTNNSPATSTISNVPVNDNSTTSSGSNIQEMQKYDMGYEHGYLDGYNGDAYNSFSGDFGKGYSVGYDNGMNDYGYGLRPEWQVNNVVYNRWSPSDKAYVDITTGQMVN